MTNLKTDSVVIEVSVTVLFIISTDGVIKRKSIISVAGRSELSPKDSAK
jgi:hypothetical protein